MSSLQLCFILPGTMTFSDILDRVGSMGPYQYLLVALLGFPILGMANHNLLQIFTATTPSHYCRPPPNASAGPWVLPLDQNGQPEKCLRFVHPPNTSLPNDTQWATEPCLDGWIYNSTRDTIVTEVGLAPYSLRVSCTTQGQEERLGCALGPEDRALARCRWVWVQVQVQMQESQEICFLHTQLPPAASVAGC